MCTDGSRRSTHAHDEPQRPTRKLSHWARPEARLAYEAAYNAALELWPIEHQSRRIETPFGTTHIVVSGPPSGEPVVLIHAASLSATQWYLQAGDLGADHRLYAVDIMGDIGLSTQARAIHSRVDAAEWLASVFDGLGIERAVVVGSSFGGFQATNLAIARSDLVRALVLLAPAATLQPFRLLANLVIRAGSLVPLPISVRPGIRGMMSGTLPDGEEPCAKWKQVSPVRTTGRASTRPRSTTQACQGSPVRPWSSSATRR